MKIKSCILVAAALAGTISAASAADITGKITLKGTPPPEKTLPLDPACGKLHPGKKPTTRFYVTDANGGLADVFVYLKGASNKPAPSSQPAVLDQVGCEYTPYILGLQAGQQLVVKNSDPLLHNVHPTPDTAKTGNKESNKAQMAGGAPLTYQFNPEVFVRFKCDVHPWMFAYVGVVDNPYYAVTGKDGSYSLKGVPEGKYTLVAHHRKSGEPQTKEITVGKDGVKEDFTFEVKAQ